MSFTAGEARTRTQKQIQTEVQSDVSALYLQDCDINVKDKN